MIDTKARIIHKLEALIGEEVEIEGERFWIASFEFYPKKGWSIRFSSEPPPDWLTK